MKTIIGLIIFLGTAAHGFSQTRSVSDPGLNGLVKLWTSADYDSLKKTLPLYQKKYSEKPEFMFLSALFNSDGAEAVKTYEIIVQRHPDNFFADQSLYRLIQYYAAMGLYQTAGLYYEQLKSKYPKSETIAKAVRLFPEKDSEATDTSGVPTNESNATGFTLQVGAFSSQINADQMVKTLKSKGITEITIKEKSVKDKKLMIVLVGSFATKDQAAAAGQKLSKDHQLNYSVVAK